MRTPALFKEYIWLVNTIHRAGRISFAEINEKWLRTEMSEGIALSRTTFNRHTDAIEDIFGIYIDCDRHDGYRYYIGNEEVLREDTVQNWMLSTLTVHNLVSESMSLQNRIVLRAFGVERYYLRDLPLHHTQRELPVAEGQDYADFELFVRPTVDIQGQLLSRGVQLKVLEPQWLADDLRRWHEDAAKMYEGSLDQPKTVMT